jgi:hypothetical protein
MSVVAKEGRLGLFCALCRRYGREPLRKSLLALPAQVIGFVFSNASLFLAQKPRDWLCLAYRSSARLLSGDGRVGPKFLLVSSRFLAASISFTYIIFSPDVKQNRPLVETLLPRRGGTPVPGGSALVPSPSPSDLTMPPVARCSVKAACLEVHADAKRACG